MSVTLAGIQPDAYVHIDVWRKKTKSKSHLVASSTKPDGFYKSVFDPDWVEGEWERLKMEFYIPPNYSDDKLKIYVWNIHELLGSMQY